MLGHIPTASTPHSLHPPSPSSIPACPQHTSHPQHPQSTTPKERSRGERDASPHAHHHTMAVACSNTTLHCTSSPSPIAHDCDDARCIWSVLQKSLHKCCHPHRSAGITKT